MKKLNIFLLIIFLALELPAQVESAEVKIMTSAICETCKKTIEHGMSFEKGVRSAKLDVETKVLTVIYNPSKTDENKLRVALTKIGYDADSLKANPKAFHKLPECCQAPGHH